MPINIIELSPQSPRQDVEKMIASLKQINDLLRQMESTLAVQINEGKCLFNTISKKKLTKNNNAQLQQQQRRRKTITLKQDTENRKIIRELTGSRQHSSAAGDTLFEFDADWFLIVETLEMWMVSLFDEKRVLPKWKDDCRDAINEQINDFETLTRSVRKSTKTAMRQETTSMGRARAILANKGGKEERGDLLSLTDVKKLKVKYQERKIGLLREMRSAWVQKYKKIASKKKKAKKATITTKKKVTASVKKNTATKGVAAKKAGKKK